MKVDINSISGGEAEVVLADSTWNAAITAIVSLDDGLFFRLEKAWIAITPDYNVYLPDLGFLAGSEQEINQALLEFYIEEKNDKTDSGD